jgi:hypothetical protein
MTPVDYAFGVWLAVVVISGVAIAIAQYIAWNRLRP